MLNALLAVLVLRLPLLWPSKEEEEEEQGTGKSLRGTTQPGVVTTLWSMPAGREETSRTHWRLLNACSVCCIASTHRVPYLALAKTFEKIEEESKRYNIAS